jgi:hypothetical protein
MTQIDNETVERLSRTMNWYGNNWKWKVGKDFSEQRAADCDRAADTLEAKDAEIARLREAAKEVVETHLLTGGGSPEAWAKHCSALATLRAALSEDDTPGENEGE